MIHGIDIWHLTPDIWRKTEQDGTGDLASGQPARDSSASSAECRN